MRWQDATLGFCCIVIILALRVTFLGRLHHIPQALNRTGWFKAPEEGNAPGSWVQRKAARLHPKALACLDKIVWFICTARNAIVVIACLAMATVLDPDIEECMESRDNCTFTLTGNIQSGLPVFELPKFSITPDNTTQGETEEYVSFGTMVSRLGLSLIIVPVVAIVDAAAIAKAFGEST